MSAHKSEQTDSAEADRQLLAHAAKAAGVCLHPDVQHSYGNWGCDTTCCSCGKDPAEARWDPLKDDRDALRLAVRLHMGIQANGPDHWQSPDCTIVLFDGPVCGHRLTQQHNGDPEAATRRAIVRAAAASLGQPDE